MSNNDNPLVSVIIPTYKRPNKLKEAINTVKDQTYKNIEIIIVDDNEPNSKWRNETKKLIESIENENIYYIEHEKNRGACAARNTGVKYANGNYIAFLDDDDVWFKSKIKKQINCIINNKTEFVYCNMYIVDSVNGKETVPDIKLDSKNTFIDLLKKRSGICTSSFLLKKKSFNKIGGFDTDFDSFQDYDFLIRLSKKTNFYFIDEPLMIYKLDKDGISKNYYKKYNGLIKFLINYEKEYKKYNLQEDLSKLYYRLAHYAFYLNSYKNAKENLIKTIKLNPFFIKAYYKLLLFKYKSIIKKI